jgi:hypothetical protein
MELSQNEWIMVGAGKLFSAPFVSRVLLYRLHDIKYSFLVYHERTHGTHVLAGVENVALARKVHELPEINVGPVVMATKACDSPIISIHYCPTSCSIAFEDLVKLPARRLSFEECISSVNNFGKIAFCIEPFSLPYSKRMLIARPNLGAKKFIMEGSDYTVTGPVGIADVPDSIPTDKVRRRCWKIQLHNVESKIRYEMGECAHWSLAALDVEEEGRLDTAVYLGN